ncbi:MAG: hypothetical protein Ct9H300mP30_0750 [Methanobacteriota archaeon]|nr:MAG: hypothetical protein Ct9H300mP30_0750 [Euryarchaeota archaeon]
MSYSATHLGERVAQLYLNPISGRIIRDGLAKAMATLTGEDDYGQVSPLSSCISYRAPLTSYRCGRGRATTMPSKPRCTVTRESFWHRR